MRKKIIGIILSAMLLFVTAALAIMGCSGDTVEYSVTVLAEDEETPVSGATVSWLRSGKAAGSAVTGADGRAVKSLAPGSYDVILSDIESGLSCESVTVGRVMRDITVSLVRSTVKYTATVKDKTGAAAVGVTVTWATSKGTAGTANTDAAGVASVELVFDSYSVTLSGTPEGNIYSGDTPTATGKSPNVVFELTDGKTYEHAVTVKSEGGLKFAGMSVIIYSAADNISVASGKTDANGVYKFSRQEGSYRAEVPLFDVPDGYKTTAAAFANRQATVVLKSEVIADPPAKTKRYVVGDIIHDYSFTTPYNDATTGSPITYKISELLKTKKAVLINNWGLKCSACVAEMAAMSEAYEYYNGAIELLGVNNYQSLPDSDAAIIDSRNRDNLPFPVMADKNDFTFKFSITGWPTTILIDRYGAIARIEVGAIVKVDAWKRLLDPFVADGYVQTFVPGKLNDPITVEISKPDIKVDADHYNKVGAAINKISGGGAVEWYGIEGVEGSENIWPFVLKTDSALSNEQMLCASNTGKDNSWSVIGANVTMPAGKALAFDYYAETEEKYDTLSVAWDNRVIATLDGFSSGWKTLYVHAAITTDTHKLLLSYLKDNATGEGKDNVYIKNVRWVDIGDIPNGVNIIRPAAYGTPAENADKYPHYITPKLGADGYYRVDIAKLDGKAYAGNDPEPMLFVDMTTATGWMGNNSLASLVNAQGDRADEYKINCSFKLSGDRVSRDYREVLNDYIHVASASDVPGCLPVDEELKELLEAFVKRAGETLFGVEYTPYAEEWLELCYYYSHYGEGNPVGNPIIGLTEKTAIAATAGVKITADLNRNMAPFPIAIYSFKPEKAAVYRIESLIPQSLSSTTGAQAWLYDDAHTADEPLVAGGDDYKTLDGTNEHNFVMYRYMTPSETYYIAVAFTMSGRGRLDFKITEVGQSARVLTAAAADIYDAVLDAKGEFTGDVTLKSVEYVKDSDGYYHAKNPDGTTGDFIYLNVHEKIDVAYSGMSIETLVDRFEYSPALDASGKHIKLDYKAFDFRYRTLYWYDESTQYTTFNDKVDVVTEKTYSLLLADSGWNVLGLTAEDFADYTAYMKGVIASADSDNFVKVDEKLVKVLSLFIIMRKNSVTNGRTEAILHNEWLRFCWYNRIYDAANP